MDLLTQLQIGQRGACANTQEAVSPYGQVFRGFLQFRTTFAKEDAFVFQNPLVLKAETVELTGKDV